MNLLIKIRAFFWKLRLKFDKDTAFIDELKLNGRARRAAVLWGVKCVVDLISLSQSEPKQRRLRGITYIGKKTMKDLTEVARIHVKDSAVELNSSPSSS